MKHDFDALVEHLLNGNMLLDDAVGLLEQRMIKVALERCAGKQTAASKLLGIHRNTLQRKMIEFEIGNGGPRRKPVARAAGRSTKRKTVA